MDGESRWEALRSDRRIVSALLLCVAVAAGVAWWRAGSGASLPAVPAPTTVATERVTTTTASNRLVVHVVGAVAKPGVLELRAGARVVDAIKAAGGASADADLARLNLAAPVSDGERIAVPGADGATPPLDPSAVAGGTVASGAAGAPVNVNTADAAQLESLPGIGPATAAAIVADREANGPFATVDDLGRVRGIGPAKLEQLRDLVVL